MAKSLVMVKQGSCLIAATEADKEVFDTMKSGKGYKVEIKQQSERSIQHHRLFFVLLDITLQYWQPKTKMFTQAEAQALKRFIEWCESETGEQGALRKLGRVYLDNVDQRRSQRLETQPKSVESLLEWIKRQVGHVECLQSPSGLIVQTKSINFNSMSQGEFEQFYKKAFDVCWREVMKSHFEVEQDLQRAIDEMVSFT